MKPKEKGSREFLWVLNSIKNAINSDGDKILVYRLLNTNCSVHRPNKSKDITIQLPPSFGRVCGRYGFESRP